MPIIENTFGILALWAVVGYLLGSIPFGIIITRVMKLGDLRDIGSGSIGATNVLRTGSKTAALLTVLLDGGKGIVAVLIARASAGEDAAQIAGLLALVGHCYPIWLKFKGGKGVATFLGILLVMSWPVCIGVCVTWLATAAFTRISSLSALVASASCIIWTVIFGNNAILVLVILLALLIYWRHIDNIKRLVAGSEPKIGDS